MSFISALPMLPVFSADKEPSIDRQPLLKMACNLRDGCGLFLFVNFFHALMVFIDKASSPPSDASSSTQINLSSFATMPGRNQTPDGRADKAAFGFIEVNRINPVSQGQVIVRFFIAAMRQYPTVGSESGNQTRLGSALRADQDVGTFKASADSTAFSVTTSSTVALQEPAATRT